MIEIICDKQSEGKDENVNDDKLFKLPKNVRQVGSPSGRYKIYIEDYVVTYLNYIARPGNTDVRGAILLGDKKMTSAGETLFIYGAVDAQNIEFDMEECQFTEEIWAEIYEQIKDNFPGLSIMGWFLSRMGFSTAINQRIEKLHIENFAGSDKVLYVSDSLESEDAFYLYEKGQMVKQKGYYIFYAKNDNMQSYIIKKRADEVGEKDTDVKRKDDELIRNYREKNKQAIDNRNYSINLSYVAGAFLSLVVIAMGITIAGNYKKMKNMEVSINRLELTATGVSYADGNSVAQDATVVPPNSQLVNTMNENGTGVSTPDEPDVTFAQDQNGATTSEPIVVDIEHNEPDTDAQNVVADADGKTNEVSAETVKQVIYKVCYGDTLSSIAEKYYGDIGYVSVIAKANNIGEDGKIIEGQEIILPNAE